MKKPKAKPKVKKAAVRLMTKHEVCDVTGLSFPTIWDKMRKGQFPRSRAYNDDNNGKACWLASEVEAWIINRPVKPIKGDPVEEKQPSTEWSS
jgi:predicted DNA-binding transcriptional regulator AlpA